MVPMEKIQVIWDEVNSTVKPDFFFCHTLKKHCSFQELCEDFKQGTLKDLGADLIVLYFGNGQIFRFSTEQWKTELQKLVAIIWARKPQSHIFVSTVIPPPRNAKYTGAAYIKANQAIQ